MSTARNRDEVLLEVARLIREVVGEAWIEEKAIGLDTSFGHDWSSRASNSWRWANACRRTLAGGSTSSDGCRGKSWTRYWG